MSLNPETSYPIGIFDSGVGGLTVLAALRERLPAENFVYLGDTARVPYGNKSPEVVTRYAFENTLFLLDRNVKMVVIACNTATAGSLDRLQRHFRRPIIGVIEPGAGLAAQRSVSGRIGVIGTVGTVASGAYEAAIHRRRPGARVHSVACPLLVPLAEEGWLDHAASRLIVAEYLDPLVAENIDVLLLGCTHYPLLRGLIQTHVGSGVQVLDSAGATAAAVHEELERCRLARSGPGGGQVEFHLSDRHPHFKRLGERFLGATIDQVHLVTY
ncbi:MAG: glutamate racemase [Candidatus Riflebacteria bacterium]|nr:glutamate racemase [Candidatus Riflebacteria bacterium]